MVEQRSIDLPMTITDPDQETMVSFWWTSTLLKRAARRFFRLHESSEAHFNLLMALRNSPEPLTQNELSQKLLVDKSHVTGLLDKLAGAGLIKRNTVADDRRSYHVTLTQAGRRTIDELGRLYADETARIMAPFTDHERDELVRLTRKLRVSLADNAGN